MRARISTRALTDLDHIYAYLAKNHGIGAADKFLVTAKEATEFLSLYPLAGPKPKWVTRHEELRFWVISRSSFLIFYFPDEHGVSIERVLDGRRDVTRILEHGLEEPPDSEDGE